MIQSYVLGTIDFPIQRLSFFEGTVHENERHTMQVYI